ncbi:MAG TPA: hypothetical protein VHM30_17030, partial [Gemmatimonadaceae bacterium]|nr:hypothetical protein [Gemmatimonadaceae bacterium]
YSSQHAAPATMVPIEVTLGAGLPLPDSVVVVVKDSLNAERARGGWRGADWGAPGATRRVGVALPSDLPTGIHTFTVSVLRYSAGASSTIATLAPQVPIVNRGASAYGRGWWVSGVESLDPASKVWVGGDGSVRRYLATSNPDVWLADAVDRPDTLRRVGSYFVRSLPDRLQIRFDAVTGEHVETENRFGRVTRFYYGTASGLRALDSVTVPVPGGTRKFRFVRGAGGYVTSIESPGIAAPRVTLLSIDGEGRLVQIQDPDSTIVSFRYDSTQASGVARYRVVKRTDRRGTPRTFGYTSGRLTSVVQRLGTNAGGGPTATTTFRPQELVGLSTGAAGAAQPLDSAHAVIDGPRTDVADVTRIWVNSYGAPVKVRNALGRDVTVTYGNAAFPALATETKAISGVVTRAWYNARALIDSVQVVNPLGDGKSPVTRYYWHASWARPDSVKASTGVVTSFGYDAMGNVQYQQVGRDAARRVTAAYQADGLYRASTVPGTTARDSVTYDAVLRNPDGSRDRLGNWTYTLTDALGRVRRTRVPLGGGRERVDSTEYDAADQVVWTRSIGPDMSYQSPNFSTGPAVAVPAETLYVTTGYDPEGGPTTVTRWGSGTGGTTGDVVTTFTYDSAGRKTREQEAGRVQSFGYDVAGQLVSHDRGFGAVTMEYDALGRVVRRVMPAVTHSGTTCLSTFYPRHSACDYNFKFPLFSSGNSLVVAGDTAVFGFDPAGNMTRADNGSARIRRSYAPGGALLTDTLRIRTVRFETEQHGDVDPNGFATHAYVLRYQYDSTGRLTGLTYPSQACASCAATYAYDDATTGALKRLTDPWGNAFDFWYGVAGTIDSVGYPGAVKERVIYDAEGRAVKRNVKLSGGYPVIDDSLAYDPLGRIAGGRTYAAPTRRYRDVWNFYAGLGALAGMEQAFSDGADPKREEFRSDAV